MLFKGNSSRLELLIGKIQAHKEPSQDEHHKSKGMYLKCQFLQSVISPVSCFQRVIMPAWLFLEDQRSIL